MSLITHRSRFSASLITSLAVAASIASICQPKVIAEGPSFIEAIDIVMTRPVTMALCPKISLSILQLVLDPISMPGYFSMAPKFEILKVASLF